GGVSACSSVGCHGGNPPRTWIRGKELLVRNIEEKIWSKSDRHADAYKALTGKRGKKMAKTLGYDVTDAKGKGKACLTCHAVVIDEPSVLQASKESGFDIKEGVICAVCHGPYTNWIAAHAVRSEARK